MLVMGLIVLKILDLLNLTCLLCLEFQRFPIFVLGRLVFFLWFSLQRDSRFCPLKLNHLSYIEVKFGTLLILIGSLLSSAGDMLKQPNHFAPDCILYMKRCTNVCIKH